MWMCVCMSLYEAVFSVCIFQQAATESHMGLPAFTGTLRTIPRDISVGYVTAIPKFNTILNAETEFRKWVLFNCPVLFLPTDYAEHCFSREAGARITRTLCGISPKVSRPGIREQYSGCSMPCLSWPLEKGSRAQKVTSGEEGGDLLCCWLCLWGGCRAASFAMRVSRGLWRAPTLLTFCLQQPSGKWQPWWPW